MTAIMLALTLGLGVWQVQRLAWKTALLQQIEQGERGPGVPLPPVPAPFQHVSVSGQYLPLGGRYGAEVRDLGRGPVMGSYLIAVLRRADGMPIVIDRGWAADNESAQPPAGETFVDGYVRPSEPRSWLGPNDDSATRRFFALDPAVIGPAFGVQQIAPFTVVAMGSPQQIPSPAQAMPRPPNDHLSYAITWFGLSAALLCVFGLYVKQALNQGSKQ